MTLAKNFYKFQFFNFTFQALVHFLEYESEWAKLLASKEKLFHPSFFPLVFFRKRFPLTQVRVTENRSLDLKVRYFRK